MRRRPEWNVWQTPNGTTNGTLADGLIFRTSVIFATCISFGAVDTMLTTTAMTIHHRSGAARLSCPPGRRLHLQSDR
jgi:hypothetical protein